MVRTMNAAENATPEANARFMFARIVPSQIGSSPFRITRKSRIFMHPLSHHMIRAEFDLSGIANLTLAPQINPLRGSCATRRDTGIVGVRLSIDGRPLGPRFIVDRDYSKTLPIDVDGAAWLRVDIDDGNGTEACDWFAPGFPSIAGAADASMSPAANSKGTAARAGECGTSHLAAAMH